MEPDPRFERTLAGLVLRTDPPARLVALSDHSAALAEPDGSYVLIYRYLPTTDEALKKHLDQVVSSLKAGRLSLILVGGPDALRAILRDVQPLFSFQRKVQVFHLPDAGPLWTGPRTPADGPVARALAEAAPEALAGLSFEALRTRLEAAVDPAADRRQEVIDFARRMRSIRPALTWALVGLCGILFGLGELWGGSQFVPTMVRMGANVPNLVEGGAFERLLGSTFLHAGLAHLLMNGLGLLILGGFIERLLGPHRLLILYVISGLAGAVASTLFSTGALSVGASGALFGLFGAAAVLAYRPRVAIPAPVLAALRRNIGFILLINLGISFLPRIDLWAHLGGAVAGAGLMLTGLLTPRPAGGDPAGATRAPVPLVVLAAALGAAALASTAWSLAEGRPWELTGPPRLVKVDLGAGASARLPEAIVARRQEGGGADAREIVFGDLGMDPVMISLELRAGPDDLAEPDRFEEQFAQLEQARGGQSIPEATRSGAPRRRTFNGVPTLEELFVYPSGVRHWRYSQLRPGSILTIHALVWADGPAAWRRVHEQVLESLETARTLRTRA